MNEQKHSTNRRVLVIDDNRAVHDDFREILDAPQGVYEIESAFQGQAGLERVRQAVAQARPYAVAFIDVRMPTGWDGVETTMRIWEVQPDLQVVICTAHSDYSLGDMMAKIGQSDRLVILKKPFDSVEVLQLTHALAEKWRLVQQVRATIEDLERMVSVRTAELRKKEERFRLIAENAADLISVTDASGRRLYNSPSYQKALGYSPEELLGTDALDKVHPEDRMRIAPARETALSSGRGQTIEYRMQHKNGSWRTLESTAAVLPNGTDGSESLLIVARDITERKKAEKERQMMEVQLRQAQKLESIGQLASGIAHEINTPIQYVGDNTRFVQEAFADLVPVLRNHTDLVRTAKEGAVTPEQLVQADKLLNQADMDYLLEQIPTAIKESLEGVSRVAKIVRAMKDFSHPGSKDKAPLDVHRAIESTVTVARNEWKYVAEVKFDFDKHLPSVPCYAGEFNQVILNLVVNAAHAIGDVVKQQTGSKGLITIRTRHDGDWAEIRVSDTGTGIPESARGRIFEPFFTTKEVGKGTGQGLAMIYDTIVNKHDGTITFETEIGKGTTFIIHLPLRKSADAAVSGRNGCPGQTTPSLSSAV